MSTGEMIGFVNRLLLSLATFIISGFHFKEKGFLFFNAYLYATTKERGAMNKKPYYRQSAIVFLLLGIIFLLNAFDMVVEVGWLSYVSVLVTGIFIVYAIASSINLERINNR